MSMYIHARQMFGETSVWILSKEIRLDFTFAIKIVDHVQYEPKGYQDASVINLGISLRDVWINGVCCTPARRKMRWLSATYALLATSYQASDPGSTCCPWSWRSWPCCSRQGSAWGQRRNHNLVDSGSVKVSRCLTKSEISQASTHRASPELHNPSAGSSRASAHSER